MQLMWKLCRNKQPVTLVSQYSSINRPNIPGDKIRVEKELDLPIITTLLAIPRRQPGPLV